MKKLFFISVIYFLCVSQVFGEVSQFVFITPEQTVGVNIISKAITIQSQDSAGTSEAVVETTDLEFKTTSTTGKFVARSGKPASKTMSKNTAKRSFYYMDSTPGTYSITVKTTGRSSKKTSILTQKIVVGSEASITEVTSVPPSSVAPTLTPVPSKPISNPVETNTFVNKKVEVIKIIPVKNSPRNASSTETKEGSGLAAVIYAAPPKTSAFDSFLWLPRKIWGTVKSIFQ